MSISERFFLFQLKRCGNSIDNIILQIPHSCWRPPAELTIVILADNNIPGYIFQTLELIGEISNRRGDITRHKP